MLLAPLLSRIAYQFGPAEYFALYLLAFSHAGRHLVEQPGQGGARVLHRADDRDDRAGPQFGHAAADGRQSAPDGRHRFPGRHRRPVRGVRGVLLHRKPRQIRRARREAGQGHDALARDLVDALDDAALIASGLHRGRSAGGRGLAGQFHDLHDGKIHRRRKGRLRHRRAPRASRRPRPATTRPRAARWCRC